MKKIPFYKMSGSGNDFIIIDNRENIAPQENQAQWVQKICARKMSAGADGLVLIENSDNADFKWRFYNSDGSLAEMCGNASRCAARFACLNKIAGENLCFETLAGIIHANVMGERVKVQMTALENLRLNYEINIDGQPLLLNSVNTGVPHVVVFVKHIENIDINNLGRKIRFHEVFAPAGTNVNFVYPQSENSLLCRTYERGVEGETLACGTGAVASALVYAAYTGALSPINIITRSNSVLTIHYTQNQEKFEQIFLEGDARIIYIGELCQESWDY